MSSPPTAISESPPSSNSDENLPIIHAPLKFLTWQPLYETEKPFQIFMNIPPSTPDQRTTNLVFTDHVVPIRDIRSLPPIKSIDEKGFVYRRHETRVPVDGFRSREIVESRYLPEVEELLRREVDGVERVFFFDWRLRKNAPEIEGEVINMNDLTTWLRPAMHVHIDQSSSAVLRRIQLQLPDEADILLQGRVRVINVWRPLIPSIRDYPLTLCSGAASSVRSTQLVECDHIRRHYMGSTMYMRHSSDLDPLHPSHSPPLHHHLLQENNHHHHQEPPTNKDPEGQERVPEQEFWYMSNQGMDDVVIFKNFDSAATEDAGIAGFAPHASFRHPDLVDGEEEGMQRRESIEVRALVFTYASTDDESDE